MKELVEFLVKNIVEHPDEVKVEESSENGVDIINLSVSETDMGRVIGKGGKVIKSIRNLTKIKAIKENKKVFLKLAGTDNAPN